MSLCSKNQVGHSIVLEEKDFRLRDISTQLFTIFDKTAAERGITLKVEYDGPADTNPAEGDRRDWGPFGAGRVKDMVVWGDKSRILQVVINLTSNALKFTPPGGSVTVNVRCIGESEFVISRKGSVLSKANSGRNSRQRIYSDSTHTSDSPQGKILATANEINILEKPAALSSSVNVQRSASPPVGAHELLFEFEVQDTGPGVPEHHRKRIFEPFFQGDMQLSKKYSGTGLGLSICSQLATLMKGTIELKSAEGLGSTFTMRIPLKHVGNRADSTASSTIERFNSPRNSTDEQHGSPTPEAGVQNDGDSGSTHSFPSVPTDQERSLPAGSQRDAPLQDPPRVAGLSAPFLVSTPTPEATGPRQTRGEHIPPSLPLRVLIAEDNATNQVVATKMLRLQKITAIEVAEGTSSILPPCERSYTNPAVTRWPNRS
jgi:osomolarity two-component system, sensor histidine kinase SLN1